MVFSEYPLIGPFLDSSGMTGRTMLLKKAAQLFSVPPFMWKLTLILFDQLGKANTLAGKTGAGQRGPSNLPSLWINFIEQQLSKKHHVRWKGAPYQTPEMACLCSPFNEYNKLDIALMTGLCPRDSASMTVWIWTLWGMSRKLMYHLFFIIDKAFSIVRDRPDETVLYGSFAAFSTVRNLGQ